MKFKNLIFDFDGTLVDSFPIIWKIYQELSQKYHLPLVGEKERQIIRSKHPFEIIKALQIPMFKLLFYLREGKKEFHSKMGEVKPIVGIKEVLDQLVKDNHLLGIVSSNSKNNIEAFLEKVNFTKFNFIHCEQSLFGKGKVIKKTLSRYNLNPDETLYFGDEVRDIEAAHSAKVKVAAVSWGFNSREFLDKYHPEYLLDSPKDLLKIV